MERVSLTDQVVTEIREEIVNGDLLPGTSLREQALSDRFQVGRSTVREAIKVLVAEGLVTHTHHRGAVVTTHTPEDVDDLIAARILIEQHVASATATGLADVGEAEAALEQLRDAVTRQDWRAAASADEAFHRALVSAAGSARITAFHAQLAGEMRLLRVSADRHLPEPDKLAAHAELLRLALAGDPKAYLDAAVRHVSRSRDTLITVARDRVPD